MNTPTHAAAQKAPRVSRRTIATGAAWAVPALSFAAAAPAMATSAPKPTFELQGGCKSPGKSCKTFGKGYAFTFNVCNTSKVDLYLYKVYYDNIVGMNVQFQYQAPPTLPVKIAAEDCQSITFIANGATNSAQSSFTMDMIVEWGHTPTAGSDPNPHENITIPLAIDTTPPTCICPR